MYDWRKMTLEQRLETLEQRKQRNFPCHSPPHRIGETNCYHITAACYEHKSIVGMSAERMSDFSERLLQTLEEFSNRIFCWCVLPNHYHLLTKTNHLLTLVKELGKLHGRSSYLWNGEENCRGRKVWYNCLDRAIRNERHFWATMNYVHHNPVHHGYVKRWEDWPFSSALEFLEQTGREKAKEMWSKYPVLDYGKGWDDPDLWFYPSWRLNYELYLSFPLVGTKNSLRATSGSGRRQTKRLNIHPSGVCA